MSKVYKLMQVGDNGKLYSLYAQGKYRTEYTPGETVERKNLFVFTSYSHAERQVDWEDQEIWECQTQSDPQHAPDYIPDYDYTNEEGYNGVTAEEADRFINEFWENPYAGGGPLRVLMPLYGSHLVNDVTLIRRIS